MKMFTFYPWTGSHGLLATKNENDPLYNGVKKLRFLDTGAYIIEHSPVLIVPVNNSKHKKDTVNTQFTEFSSHAKNLGKQITHNVPFASLWISNCRSICKSVYTYNTVTIECFHMTSRRPCWCPKPVPWELNCFLMQTLYFVTINLHICWPREWKHSVKTWWRLRIAKKSN